MDEKLDNSLEIKPNYFSFHVNCLLVMGVDIKPIANTFLKALFYVYSFLFLGIFAYVFTGLEIVYICFVGKEINDLTFSLTYAFTHLLGCIKITYMLFNRNIFWKMLQKIENGYFKPSLDKGGIESFKKIKAANTLTDMHVYFFYVMALCIISLRSVSFMIHNTKVKYDFDIHTNTTKEVTVRLLPYFTWFPYDVQKSPTYEIVFIYQVASYVFFGGYIGAIDALIYGFIIHTKVHFEILKKCLINFGDYAKRKVLETHPEMNIFEKSEEIKLAKDVEKVELFTKLVQEEAEKRVIFCVQYHQKIIEWRDEIEKEVNYVMLLQFISSTYIACFQLYQISVINPYKQTFDFFSMSLYLLLMMYQLFSYCWHGNEVLEESASVSFYAFSSDWLRSNETIKKSLLLMMMRAQRPLYFTAGKFALLSFEMYASIVRASVSYFMLLRQLKK